LTAQATAQTRRVLQEPIVSDHPNDGNGDEGGSGRCVLWLAGEHTNPTQAAMVHGAYQEGVRAAKECLQHWKKETRINEEAVDIVVIGAGAAGLGCAHQLLLQVTNGEDKYKDIKRKVVVLEARDRIGGRVWTEPLTIGDSQTFQVELGANWLQQGDANPLASIAKEKLQLRLIDTHFLQPSEYPLHRHVPPDRVDAIMKQFVKRSNQRAGRYAAAAADSDDLNFSTTRAHSTMQDVLDDWLQDLKEGSSSSSSDFTMEEIRHVLEGEILVDAGVPLSKLSSQFGMEPGVGEGDRWIVGGYKQLFDQHLARGVDIRHNCIVTRIDTSHPTGRVCITYRTFTKNEVELLADAVICTIPSAVLQQGSIEFVPPLPQSHQTALGALITGRVEKVVLAFDERWWPPATASNGYIRAYGTIFGDVSEWLDCTDVFGVPVITGIFSGPWVEDIWKEGSSSEEVALKATAALYRAIHETSS